MKKFISCLLCLLLLFSMCFSVSAINYNNEKNFIRNIAPGTTISELKALISDVHKITKNNITLPDDAYIGTGYDIYWKDLHSKAVVLGDVNGDANVSSADYLIIKRAFLGTHTLTGEYKLAADIDEDGAITSFDYLSIKRHVLGTYTIGTSKIADSVPVLLYHHILPDDIKATKQWQNNDITISVSEFRRHMQLINDSGYSVVTMDELINYIKGEQTLPKKSLVLCFDDGYKSNTTYAAPILREFGYQATIFGIMKMYLNNYEPYFEPNILQHVTHQDLLNNSDVFNQQCHTFANHEHLSTQSYHYVFNDLMQSQDVFPSKYFAYPYGDYDTDVINAVKDAGFEAAFTTVERNAVVGDNLYEIPRHTITTPMSNNGFLNILN